MNPFKNRKKAKDDFAAPRPSVESESSSPFRMFGRKKSQDEGTKREIDLATALPSNDDFRTSLLMTGLSARFSMLREQDDPNTKVGKASDDSVLYPNRQSRMGDFGFGLALQDIAEVESIRAPYARADSYHSSDDGASVNTSIMNRGKAIEGNTLFGGKQRIYKIAAGSKSGNSSRPVLQDEESSQSAFQKWRLAEREKEQPNPNQNQDETNTRDRSSLPADEAEDQLPDVYDAYPQTDRDRRRETTSTTSSGPSAARNSTAATSITSSQPASSVKDWQANVNPGMGSGMDRSVTRARRLYEQGLNQDLHDQQSSALSRIDTLSRQRAFGTRTPDLSPMANSPIATFNERISDRRPLIAKASAPNLRSFTPPTLNQAPMSPPETNSNFPAPEQQQASFGGLPPLSPPMSETEEQSSLPIQSDERSRSVTAMFSRPLQQYDDTRYAQRARQLQQGRDSTGSRQRAESNATVPTTRSASVASSHGNASEKPEATFKTTEPTVEEETHGRTFFRDDDDGDFIAPFDVTERRRPPLPPPQAVLERPNDHEHPALRKVGTPAPLNLASQEPERTSAASIKPGYAMASPKDESPEDSPTLGPNSGLSGMVRQHLRNTSTASSIYDPVAMEAQSGSGLRQGPPATASSGQLVLDTSLLELSEADWDMAHGHRASIPDSAPTHRTLASEASPIISISPSVEPPAGHEQDDFARHLADGARRVREKLNSYVESDSAPPSPLNMAPSDSTRGSSGALRPNPLGILKSKSSRGSLVDRDRSRENLSSLQVKPAKTPGLDTMSSSPVQATMTEKDESFKGDSSVAEEGRTSEEKEPVHAGLKAFRQARRELQRIKELEAKQRHQAAPHQAAPVHQQQPQDAEVPPRPRRLQSQERGPPPSSYVPPQEDPRSRSGSRSESRTSERDRSGSDTSNGGRSHSRPARLRNGSVPYEEHPVPYGHGMNGMPRPNLTLRSPVPPGMESKRSPMVSPHHYGGASPGGFGRPEVSPGGRSPGRNIFEVSHNHAEGYRQGPVRHGNLPAATTSTPNLLPPTSAPPLPPINPRRRTRRETLTVDNGDELNAGTPQSPMSPRVRAKSPGALYMSEDDGGPEQYRRRLRKVTSEASIRNGRLPSLNTSPSRRPPMPPMPVSAGPLSNNGMSNAF